VPDTTEIRIDPETNTLMREGVPSILNPHDAHAAEEAVRLKERYGGRTTALSMGPPQAVAALRTCISLGIDRAVLLSDRAFAGADTFATSYTIASAIRRLAEEEPVEYLSHMIPEGGFDRMPRLFDDGVMIVGDAAMLVNGIHREGANHAILSGKAAGETVVEAHKAGDFSARTLSQYRRRLWSEAPTLRDLKKYRGAVRYMSRHPGLLSLYPKLASDAAYEMLKVDEVPKRGKQWKIIRSVLRHRGFWGLLWDAIDGWRSLW